MFIFGLSERIRKSRKSSTTSSIFQQGEAPPVMFVGLWTHENYSHITLINSIIKLSSVELRYHKSVMYPIQSLFFLVSVKSACSYDFFLDISSMVPVSPGARTPPHVWAWSVATWPYWAGDVWWFWRWRELCLWILRISWGKYHLVT